MTEISRFATLQPVAQTFEAHVPVPALWKLAFEMIEQAPHRATIVRDLTGYEVSEHPSKPLDALLNRAAGAALQRCFNTGALTIYVSDGRKLFRLPSNGEVDVSWSQGILEADGGSPYHWIAASGLALMTAEADEARVTKWIADLIAASDPLHLAAQLDPDLPAAFRKMQAAGEPLKKGTVGRHLADIKGAAGLKADVRERRIGMWKRRISRAPWPPFEAAWNEMLAAELSVPAVSPSVFPNIPELS